MLKFVYKVLPVIVHYVSDDSKRPKMAGVCYGPYIRIKESYKDDEGLLEHELEHTRQVYRWCFIQGLLYTFSKKWRYKFEFEAYALQLTYTEPRYQKSRAMLFAGFIADKYNLSVDRTKTAMLLMESLNA